MLYYHYCSYEKFERIIKSKTLWLTPIVKSNDAEEVIRTFKIIWNRIREQVAEGIKDLPDYMTVMSILDNQMNMEAELSVYGEETPYGICLTVNRDLAQNWNEYGEMSRGVALGFSNELMSNIPYELPHPNVNVEQAIGWHEIYYDREELSKRFAPLFVNELRNNHNAMGWLNVRTTLKHYSAFIKNPTFKDEREVRIVYYPNDDHTFQPMLGVTNIIINPIQHCELQWLRPTGESALKEIIVGTNCGHTEKEIERFLVDSGIDDKIRVVKSEYPYRTSNNR